MEAQHRDSILIHDVRVDIAVRVFVRYLFTAPGEADRSTVMLIDSVLEIFAVAFVLAAFGVERTHGGHMESAADLDVIAARKLLVSGIPEPPRDVEVHAAHAVRIVARQLIQGRNVRAQRIAHAISHIPAYLAGAVRETVG